MSDVPAGKMRLFTRFQPVWRPGTHFLWLQQEVREPGDNTPLVATQDGLQTEFVFQVTGPRTTLPPVEVLGCFPTPGTQGAVDTCLPHIVLRRRTLPWERALSSASADPSKQPPPATPWLALLLLPADQAILDSGPLSQVYSASQLQKLGLDGTLLSDQVQVPRGLLRQVMPRKQDLALLAHARQLSLSDREAKDDDDGFMSLVLCNRLPTPGTAQLACLVSLEGQWDADIWPGAAELEPVSLLASPKQGGSSALSQSLQASSDAGSADADFAGGNDPGPEPVPVPMPSPLDLMPVRLVVLHSWRFTAGEGGDFEALIQHIGPDGVKRLGAEVPELAGFIPLKHRDSSGEEGQSLYRGPLVPVPLARDPGGALSADAALELAPDGQLLVSHAAAFELGRLLTLASDDAMTALQAWRGDVQSERATQYLLEDHFIPELGKVYPNQPVELEHVFDKLFEPSPLLNAAQLQRFAGDPSGIAHLMEQLPGFTWSTLSQFRPGLLSLDFSSQRSIDAHAQLQAGPVLGGQSFPGWNEPGSLPLLDVNLSQSLDVGFSDVVGMALGLEFTLETP